MLEAAGYSDESNKEYLGECMEMVFESRGEDDEIEDESEENVKLRK